MRLGTAIERLVENYNYAVSKEWVQDKVAWALYHTWKEADERKAEQTEPSDNSCKTCRYGEVDEGYVLCKYHSKAEQTEPQKKEVEWVYNKRERLWYPYSNGELLFKDEPTNQTDQTETQNSNLTFEKDECAKEYEELGLKELKELINADRKTEPQYDVDKGTVRCDNCSENGSYKCTKCDGEMYFKRLEDEPQTERSE